jgi:hypothetical protein
MTAKAKLAQKRLTLLQLAEKLGNVFPTCQMHKMSRSQFYEYSEGGFYNWARINIDKHR